MGIAPPRDPLGPQRQICLACSIPMRDDDGELLRDDRGFPRFRCDLCIAQAVDRLCECFLCPWIKGE